MPWWLQLYSTGNNHIAVVGVVAVAVVVVVVVIVSLS